MLIPMPAEQRAYRAPRTFSGTTRLPLNVSTGTDPGTGPGTTPSPVLGAAPTAGAAQSLAGVQTIQPKPSRGPAIMAGLIIGVGVAGFSGYKVTHQRHAPAAHDDGPTVTAVVETPPAPTPPPVTEPQAPVERTVHLLVTAPAGAVVEIDDHEVTMQDGGVDIRGTLGSTHKVRIHQGKNETVGEIVIADSGAVPPKVQFGVAIVKPKPDSSSKPTSTKKSVEPGVARQFD